MTGPAEEGDARERGRWRDGPRALGWWLLPLFLVVGLAGAVLATALVVVSQTQRIEALRDETAAARSDLADAVEEVESAAGRALETIRDEVDAVRDGLSTELPLEDAAEQGVVHLTVEVPVPRTEPAATTGRGPGDARVVPVAAPQTPDPDAQDPDAQDPDAQDPDVQDPAADDPGTDDDGEDVDDGEDDGDPSPPPEPAPPATTTRTASGFVVAREDGTTFLVTTFALLADPRGGDRPLDRPVQARTARGEVTARIHSWDAAQDLLLLRVGGEALEPLPWRPEDRPLSAGDRVVAVGVTPTLAPVQVGGTIAAVTDGGLLTDVPPLELLAGGPVVDAEGRVVAMASRRATPFGEDPVAVPIRRLCGELLVACPE